MEKTITIDGKEIIFKSTGAVPMRYRAQFGSDFFSDMMSSLNVVELMEKKTLNTKDLQTVNFEVFYQMLWTMAKTANKEIKDPITWLDEFDEFPIFEIIPEVIDLLLSNMQSTKKK